MMARMSSVGTEAFSRGDRISNGLKSNGLSSAMRDHISTLNASRMDRLLGIGAQPQTTVFDSGDVNELVEEDIWGAVEGKNPSEEVFDGKRVDVGYVPTSKDTSDAGGDPFRFLSNGRRWLDSGLSVAYGDGTRSRGLHSYSSLNRFASNGHTQQSSGREGTSVRTPSRLIPPNAGKSGSHLSQSSASVENNRLIHQQSAPVNVPDWSKILGTERKAKEFVDDSVDGDDDDEDEERLPPHELIAREFAKSRVTTFSMCEGSGCTLKGRDLSRVRNAVLRKTGFIDQ